MHNSSQNDIFLTLLMFAAAWGLISYIFHKMRSFDDSGMISRGELKYKAKYRKAVKALLASYMYTHWVLRAVSKDVTDKEKYYRTAELSGPQGDTLYVSYDVVNSMFKRDKLIHIKDVEMTPYGSVILYGLTIKGRVYMIINLIRYHHLLKHVKQLGFKFI